MKTAGQEGKRGSVSGRYNCKQQGEDSRVLSLVHTYRRQSSFIYRSQEVLLMRIGPLRKIITYVNKTRILRSDSMTPCVIHLDGSDFIKPFPRLRTLRLRSV